MTMKVAGRTKHERDTRPGGGLAPAAIATSTFVVVIVLLKTVGYNALVHATLLLLITGATLFCLVQYLPN